MNVNIFNISSKYPNSKYVYNTKSRRCYIFLLCCINKSYLHRWQSRKSWSDHNIIYSFNEQQSSPSHYISEWDVRVPCQLYDSVCVVIPISQCKQYKHNLITTVNSNMQITTQVGFYLKPRIQFSTMWSYGFITVTLNKHSSNGRPTRGSYLKIWANILS